MDNKDFQGWLSAAGGLDAGTAARRHLAVLSGRNVPMLTAVLDPVRGQGLALLVSDGSASYPPCAAALGVSREALNRSMRERSSGRSLHGLRQDGEHTDRHAAVEGLHCKERCLSFGATLAGGAATTIDELVLTPRRPRSGTRQ